MMMMIIIINVIIKIISLIITTMTPNSEFSSTNIPSWHSSNDKSFSYFSPFSTITQESRLQVTRIFPQPLLREALHPPCLIFSESFHFLHTSVRPKYSSPKFTNIIVITNNITSIIIISTTSFTNHLPRLHHTKGAQTNSEFRWRPIEGKKSDELSKKKWFPKRDL